MANELDEMNPIINENGKDVSVIEKQLPVKVGIGSKIFEVLLWVLGIIPGVVFLFKKINAGNYFSKLQQKIQHDASQIDNYLEQRVVVLKNCAKLLDKAIDLDKSTFTEIAKYRSGNIDDNLRNEMADKLGGIERKIQVAFENYPDLKAHREIENALNQNSYLQKEITAARELYNDTIVKWNTEIYSWPTKMIVASKRGYTTRIPFSTSNEIKKEAREILF